MPPPVPGPAPTLTFWLTAPYAISLPAGRAYNLYIQGGGQPSSWYGGTSYASATLIVAGQPTPRRTDEPEQAHLLHGTITVLATGSYADRRLANFSAWDTATGAWIGADLTHALTAPMPSPCPPAATSSLSSPRRRQSATLVWRHQQRQRHPRGGGQHRHPGHRPGQGPAPQQPHRARPTGSPVSERRRLGFRELGHHRQPGPAKSWRCAGPAPVTAGLSAGSIAACVSWASVRRRSAVWRQQQGHRHRPGGGQHLRPGHPCHWDLAGGIGTPSVCGGAHEQRHLANGSPKHWSGLQTRSTVVLLIGTHQY